jgi:hypothetical protein
MHQEVVMVCQESSSLLECQVHRLHNRQHYEFKSSLSLFEWCLLLQVQNVDGLLWLNLLHYAQLRGRFSVAILVSMRGPFDRELVHQSTCTFFLRHCPLYLPVEQFEQNSHYLLVAATYGARLELRVNFQANFLSN